MTEPVTIYRHDYRPPAWQIKRTHLHFMLSPEDTVVTSELSLQRLRDESLVLDGVDLQLESVSVDGVALPTSAWLRDASSLTLSDLPAQCTLGIVTRIKPAANTALEGLYLSSGTYCTQCEAEGFRKITYYLDRPDVLSVFDVVIEADQATCPLLLSNGNPVASELLADGRHRCHWHDPHPKPSYLFALVAGDLASIEDTFTTASGRKVGLSIHVQAHNRTRCEFAMQSLKAAMRWDETEYGLEYDLDRFMIVAVDDFNMGAMENKGLNVFNSAYVLADRETATDSDFMGIEAVVAHEYFHNWTGNRITCRDWFQLSLKEGLTVFRDQSFTSDRHDATVKRIEDVRLLRTRQFAEDAGPLAHPIRPDSYIEINNFYTATVYEKGAEVIRMLHTLIGPEAWRRGMDIYIARHDGTAATCDDFVAAMEAGSGMDLTEFRRWYSIAGTPELQVTEAWDDESNQLTLVIEQRCPDTPGQTDKAPMHIPLKLGLLARDGTAVPMTVGRTDGISSVIDIKAARQQVVFEGLTERPVLSVLRDFSAPVRLIHEVSDDTLAFQLRHDQDGFNRWEAAQRMAAREVERQLVKPGAAVSDIFLDAMHQMLADASLTQALKAEMLSLPTHEALAEDQPVIDVAALHTARSTVAGAVATHLESSLVALIEQQTAAVRNEPFSVDTAAIAARRLSNTALALLGNLEESNWLPLALSRYRDASNMTDRVAALALLCDSEGSEREECLAGFHGTWQAHRLVIDKWFGLQAMADRASIIDDIDTLLGHPDYTDRNPNRVRSLVARFAMGNPVHFHRADGRGHRWLADQILHLDPINPQLAARLVQPLGRWRRYGNDVSASMRQQLQRIAAASSLSPDVFEIVNKSLI